jgi:hypothetical protein
MGLHNATSGHIEDLKSFTLVAYRGAFDIPLICYLHQQAELTVELFSTNVDAILGRKNE